MNFAFKNRKLIQYSLIACTLLIQIIILIFFYNEYINENKLIQIKEQIEESKKLKQLTHSSKTDLLNAQNFLNDYLNNPQKEYLDSYFISLKNATHKIDSTKYVEEKIYSDSEFILSEERESELKRLEKLIDSLSEKSPKISTEKAPPIKTTEFRVETKPQIVKTEEIIVRDSTPKRKFFPRLGDAISGKVNVKTDTVYITTKYENSVDTVKIKEEYESSVSQISEHYLGEIKNYREHLQSIQAKNKNVYNVYNSLISLSNNLIDIQELTSDDLEKSLEKQYNERFSKNNQIRRFALFGLMVLLFFVLMIMAYYTKLSFLFEKKLKEANDRINSNLAFKTRILGMLSHEIRSPLKIMNIFIDRIDRTTSDERVKDGLKSIRYTNNSLMIQANQILDYTKNQNKQIELHPVKFNLRGETDSILEIFEPYINSVNNVLLTNNDIPENLTVDADKSKIHQVFTNLLGNANKFTQNGEISVDLKAIANRKNNINLQVRIADTGTGISESDIKNIFKPYYKGMIDEKIENLGAGLGLNLCKEIIQLFKGNISIESELGKGTVINFNINLNLVADE